MAARSGLREPLGLTRGPPWPLMKAVGALAVAAGLPPGGRTMNAVGARALIIDDDPGACASLARALEGLDVAAYPVTSAAAALDAVTRDHFDVAIADVELRCVDGLQLCARLTDLRPEMPVIVLTAMGDQATAVGALRARAYDLLCKPLDLERLALSVHRAVQHGRLGAEVRHLRAGVDAIPGPSDIIGSSAPMRQILETIARVAASDATVLLCGETGTGKELVARRIHESSSRRTGPFVSLNCAAVPPALLESELFGHVRGAFTDARTARVGLFVQAHRGSLFLDEIAETPLEMQAKLLRVLQQRAVRPLGSNSEVSFDTRVIAATNRDLEDDVARHRFRQDLFYRVNVVRIDLPPLRERGSDVLELAQRALAAACARSGRPVPALSRGAAERLLAYPWPGNVRELENCVERALAFSTGDAIEVCDLPPAIQSQRVERLPVEVNDAAEILTLAQLERRYIQRVLFLLGNNKVRAAALLGIDRRTLYRKLAHTDRRVRERTHA